ncbi:MAG TPA: HAD-IA family hydrolase [Thermoanaerobaculia bacterium]|nr:HAD-IA family hydrolase [Thermoanaerobaculia bacterium]
MRAVLFDAGATLLYPRTPVEEVYAREFRADGCAFTAASLAEALSGAWEKVRSESASDRYAGVHGEPAFWRGFVKRVRGFLDGGTVSEEAFRRLAAHFRDPASWAIYADVRPTLDALARRGLSLAVVSNWDSQLPALLENLGLVTRFQVLAVSAIEQTGKPEPEIFLRTCVRLSVSPGEALHVGDSLREDYEAARAAGLSALLLDREDRHPGVADRIRTLTEIPGWMEAEAVQTRESRVESRERG